MPSLFVCGSVLRLPAVGALGAACGVVLRKLLSLEVRGAAAAGVRLVLVFLRLWFCWRAGVLAAGALKPLTEEFCVRTELFADEFTADPLFRNVAVLLFPPFAELLCFTM